MSVLEAPPVYWACRESISRDEFCSAQSMVQIGIAFGFIDSMHGGCMREISLTTLALALLSSPDALAQTCTSQNTTTSSPGVFWDGKNDHISGDHQLIYNWTTQCTYSGSAQGSGTCSTFQLTQASFASTFDNQNVNNAPSWQHHIFTKTQQRSAQAQGAGTAAADTSAGVVVQTCITAGCAPLTFTVPPFTVSGANVVDDAPFVFNTGCPAKTFDNNKNTGCSCRSCGCGSPLMVDIGDTGTDVYELTNLKQGIDFDLKNTGEPQRIAWTKPNSNFAVLVLPDNYGEIRNSNQLFGNFTPQPTVRTCGKDHQRACPANGFIALSVWDQPDHGGNGDGKIDKNDSVYFRLRLLLGKPDDPNRKLLTLEEAHIVSISLNWQPAEDFEDTFGNLYRYESVVTTDIPGSRYPNVRWMYDTWLLDQRIGDKTLDNGTEPSDIRK
jgi:hypothetical protein